MVLNGRTVLHGIGHGMVFICIELYEWYIRHQAFDQLKPEGLHGDIYGLNLYGTVLVCDGF